MNSFMKSSIVISLLTMSLSLPANDLIDKRYVDNQDGTITDLITNLTWKRCSEGQSWTGNSCSGDAIKYRWDEAFDLFTDNPNWRLPTREELLSIRYCSKGEQTEVAYGNSMCVHGSKIPSINELYFPNTKEIIYWSSSTVANSGAFAYAVYFGTGLEGSNQRYRQGNVRLVRSVKF